MAREPSLQQAIAANRFGLGQARLDSINADGADWLRAQIGPADRAQGDDLITTAEALRKFDELARDRKQMRHLQSEGKAAVTQKQQGPDPYRAVVEADVRSRLVTAARTQRPFAERLTLFWANHFTVSSTKGGARGLIGSFEREAIRPHIAGSFETLLGAAIKHPAMLRYLDNVQSIGPNSRAAERRTERRDHMAASADAMAQGKPPPHASLGLNENLAREVLELHTLGAVSSRGGSADGKVYTQADVTEFAKVLTGWRATPVADLGSHGTTFFDAHLHEPGSKRLLGRTYPEGPQALDAVVHDLAHHLATARFLSTKLARHFVADDPPPALVDKLAAAYQKGGGDLASVYRALIDAPESWQPALSKLRTPEEFVITTARVLGPGDALERLHRDGGMRSMGQAPLTAPSPAGWPDRADDWLGPEAVWKRIEWSVRLADTLGRDADARAIARASFGPLLSANTATQIDRAADGPQALTLLLMSPEFQRR